MPSLPGEAERSLWRAKEWAHNNVPGKKGFQPKGAASPGARAKGPIDGPDTTATTLAQFPEAGAARFKKPMGRASISEDHTVYWDSPAAAAVAELYTAHAHRATYGDGASYADKAKADQFDHTFRVVADKRGFVGSGYTTYEHIGTGRTFHIERHANGKSFWGTDHSVTEVDKGWRPTR